MWFCTQSSLTPIKNAGSIRARWNQRTGWYGSAFLGRRTDGGCDDTRGGSGMSTSAPVISRRRLMAAAAVALPMVGLAKMIGSEDVGAADVAATIVNFTFQPNPLTVPVGTVVVWTNQDT